MRGPIHHLIGCDWGEVVFTTDDHEQCRDRATRRVVLHRDVEKFYLQVCPKHMSRLAEETTMREERS